MTREEEIQKAKTEYANEHLYYPGEIAYERDIIFMKKIIGGAFKDGVEWADKHHKDNTPWISVKDAIPYDYAKGICLVRFEDGSTGEMTMRKVKFWAYPYIEHGCVTHWKPISQI